MYEYVATFEDFKAAQQLTTRCNKAKFARFVFFLRIMPIVGTASLAILIWDMSARHFAFPPIVGAVLFGVAWFGIYPVLYRPFQMRSLYKRMKNDRPEGSSLQVGVEGQELICRIPGVSEGRLLRSAVRQVLENDDLVLLYVGKKNFLLFPKRALPPHAIAEIKRWLEGSS